MAGFAQGLGSMAPARIPTSAPGVMQVGAPFFGPDAPPSPNETMGEEPMMQVPEESAISKLLGQFNQEIDLADDGRLPKERKFIKVEKYLAGKDVQDPPEGYEESTFFYRRLPRIVQIGKAKLFKHVSPIHGRPWEVKPSPRHNQNVAQDEQNRRIGRLREEIEDIHEAMDCENLLDDMCEHMSALGTAVIYGPTQLSQPRLRWQDGSEVLEDADANRPMWKVYDPKSVYPDPNGRKSQDLEYVHFHHILSAHQIRSLQDDNTFIKEELAELIKDLPTGNWAGNLKKWEIAPFPTNVSNAALNRYLVWMRVGFLTAEALDALGEKFGEKTPDLKGLDSDQRKAMAESLWEIWFCDKHVLKISKRKFQPKKMPVYFVPFRRDPTSIFGIGAGEAALEVVEMLVNITRAIDDALADTSGFQAIIDAGAIENKDLRIRGRKTWIYRNKGVARKEGPAGKPIDFFTVPSNMDHLMACFKLFESMLPVVTGIPEMVTGQDMGSGVRTDQMMTDIWASLEEFLKDVVGNVDRYWWKPHLRDTYQWIQTYYRDQKDFQIEADLQVQGVRGALRRELVGRKVADIYEKFHQFGLPDWFDEVELGKAIMEGAGIETEKAMLTPDQYVERQALKAKQKELQAAAGQAPENAEHEKERAHTSARDAVIESFKALMSANPTDPATIPLLERIFKLTGQLDARSEAALSVRSKMLAQQYAEQGFADAYEKKQLEAPVVPDSPLDLTPAAQKKKQFDPNAAKEDTVPARVNPEEAAMLESQGGAGAVNPATGETHFYGGGRTEGGGMTGGRSGSDSENDHRGDNHPDRDVNAERAAAYNTPEQNAAIARGDFKSFSGVEGQLKPGEGYHSLTAGERWKMGLSGGLGIVRDIGAVASANPLGIAKGAFSAKKDIGNLTDAFSGRQYTGTDDQRMNAPTRGTGSMAPTHDQSGGGGGGTGIPIPPTWAPGEDPVIRQQTWNAYVQRKGTA